MVQPPSLYLFCLSAKLYERTSQLPGKFQHAKCNQSLLFSMAHLVWSHKWHESNQCSWGRCGALNDTPHFGAAVNHPQKVQCIGRVGSIMHCLPRWGDILGRFFLGGWTCLSSEETFSWWQPMIDMAPVRCIPWSTMGATMVSNI